MGCKRAKDRYVELLTTTHQPSEVKETPHGDEATQEPSIQSPKDNEDVARLGGRECYGPNFQRVLECSRVHQNVLESSGICYNVLECS